MFKTVWPLMKERSNKAKSSKRCAIVDLSSIASILPHHQLSVYGATKDFNQFVTLGLSAYLSNPAAASAKDIPTDIDFLSVKPYFVDSNMTTNYKKNLQATNHPDAKYFVSAIDYSYECLGQLGRLRKTPGHSAHSPEYTKQQIVKTLLPEDFHHIVWAGKFPVKRIEEEDS